MPDDTLPIPGGYHAGDRVRIVLGDLAGIIGQVLTLAQAQEWWPRSGLPGESFSYREGDVCVGIILAEIRVPLSLSLDQIKREPLG